MPSPLRSTVLVFALLVAAGCGKSAPRSTQVPAPTPTPIPTPPPVDAAAPAPDAAAPITSAPVAAAVAPPAPVIIPAYSGPAVAPAAPGRVPPDLRCSKDADCTVDSDRNCCGGCPRTLPFRAISKRALAKHEKLEAAQCAREDWDCDLVECQGPQPPKDCRVAAVCTKKRCLAVASAACSVPLFATPPPPAACITSADCTLATDHDCCGDCGVSYPFRPMNIVVETERRAERDKVCAVVDMDCGKYTCASAPPPGCFGKALCQRGLCIAQTTGRCPAP